MSHLPKKYPYDATGNKASNKIVGEYRVLPRGPYRVIVPEYSAFFTRSMRVFDRLTSQELTKDQFKCLHLHLDLTLKTAQEVATVIAVTDPKVSDNIELVYSTVGYVANSLKDPILELLEAYANDDRKVNWYTGITNKPDKFPVAPHPHHIADIKGWENIINRMRGIRQALFDKDRSTHKHILDVFEEHTRDVDQKIEQTRQELIVRLANHIEDTDNPHNVTKYHVELDLVENYPPATIAQAEEEDIDLMSDESYMTPFLIRRQIDANYQIPFNEHVSNTNNPHKTTKGDLELGNVQNYNVASLDAAVEGTSNELYMTPYLTKEAIRVQALNPFYNHKDNRDNPHRVRKEQLYENDGTLVNGLGNVQNYLPATDTVAIEGTSSVHYSTARGTKLTIDSLLINPIDDHKVNLDNPHQVSKDQLYELDEEGNRVFVDGLSNLKNYPPATQKQAIVDKSDEHYVTPKQAFDITQKVLVDPIDFHKSRRDNPHRVTKFQIGLGLLNNFPRASPSQATSEPNTLSNNHYMTPASAFASVSRFGQELVDIHASEENPHGLTAETLGLGKVPNLSWDELKELLAVKGHEHEGYATKDDLEDKVTNNTMGLVMDWVETHAKYAVNHYGKGELITAPKKPEL